MIEYVRSRMIWLILFVAFCLRLVVINQSLWLDEAINVNVASHLNFKNLLLSYSLSDFHPPLYHAILKSWILIFGNSEISVRMPSVLLGVGVVYITYLIGKKLYDTKTGLIAATLVATAPLHIYYSQEARMYMLAAFFAALSVYFFISIVKKDNIFLWLGFIFATAIMLYSDYLPYLMVAAYMVYLWIFRKKISKSTLRSFIPAFFLIFILITPWLVLLPKHLSVGLSTAAASPAWAQVVGSPDLKTFLLVPVKFTIGRISADSNLLYTILLVPAALYVVLVFAISALRLSSLRSFTLFWLFIPITLAIVVSFFIPIFSYFRFVFVLPAFYLVWASAINSVNWAGPTRAFLLVALFINLACTSIYFINPKFHRENWKQATKFVTQESTPRTIALFESTAPAAPFDYYNRRNIPAFGALDSFSPNPQVVKQNVEDLTRTSNKVFLFQYLAPITDPGDIVFQELTRLGFTNSKTHNFQGVGFIYEFQK